MNSFGSEVISTGSPSDLDELLSLNLTIYYSRDSLSLRIYDYSNVFLLPAICLFGLFTGAINIFIIAKTGVTENIHLYMMIGAVADFVFLLTQVFIAIIR